MRRALSTIFLMLFVWLSAAPGFAQTINLINDAEIESMLRDFSAPLFKAAGLNPNSTPIYIINDRRFNAFVVESGAMFINYGTIIDSETPNALKAVIAHEIGHLAGGHIHRLQEQAEIAGRMQAVSTLLGIGVLAAAAGRDENGEVGKMVSAFLLGSMSASQNHLLAYRRSEESAADAAAVTYLERTKQSPDGLIDVLNTLHKNQAQQASATAYLRTHPLAEDRINQVQSRAASSPFRNKRDNKSDVERLEMAKAKIIGFLERTQTVMTRYPNSDKSLAARYARTIAGYRAGAGQGAIKQMSALVSAAPNNAYFHEMLGQMYFETGNPNAAVGPLAKAVRKKPNEPEILLIYALALIDTGNKANIDDAISQLKRIAVTSPKSARPHTILARAYAKIGDIGQADLATAEAALIRGETKLARGLAKKAQQILTKGSPAWLRADDILALF
jgi:predicted Zn-dependent protease